MYSENWSAIAAQVQSNETTVFDRMAEAAHENGKTPTTFCHGRA
jgi:hypothetical protein